MTGFPGKWPWKNGSFIVTFFTPATLAIRQPALYLNHCRPHAVRNRKHAAKSEDDIQIRSEDGKLLEALDQLMIRIKPPGIQPIIEVLILNHHGRTHTRLRLDVGAPNILGSAVILSTLIFAGVEKEAVFFIAPSS